MLSDIVQQIPTSLVHKVHYDHFVIKIT